MTVFRLATPGTITVATYTGFVPVSWCDENNITRGRDIDFLRAFAAQWNLNIVFKFFPFDEIWKQPSTDEIDIAAAGIAPLKSRETSGMIWSEPYYTVQRSLLIRTSDCQQFRTIEDFANKKILVTRGSTAQLDTEQRKPKSTEIVYYDGDQTSMISQLLDGTIDAIAEGEICTDYLAKTLYPNRLAVIDVHSMDESEQFVFAVREASENLLDALNDFIQSNRQNY